MTPETYHYLFGNLDAFQATCVVIILATYALANLAVAGWCFYKLLIARR